eukprot:scaffold1194_cov369-Prasinococcus_capsulatus_cf.AAC.4
MEADRQSTGVKASAAGSASRLVIKLDSGDTHNARSGFCSCRARRCSSEPALDVAIVKLLLSSLLPLPRLSWWPAAPRMLPADAAERRPATARRSRAHPSRRCCTCLCSVADTQLGRCSSQSHSGAGLAAVGESSGLVLPLGRWQRDGESDRSWRRARLSTAHQMGTVLESASGNRLPLRVASTSSTPSCCAASRATCRFSRVVLKAQLPIVAECRESASVLRQIVRQPKGYSSKQRNVLEKN